MFRQYFIGLIVIIGWSLGGCVAEKDLILPTKEQREARVSGYKKCVALATNSRYDEQSEPSVLVRSSMDSCKSAKYLMLKDYPKSWSASLEKRVDEEVYKREIAWVLETRQKRSRR